MITCEDCTYYKDPCIIYCLIYNNCVCNFFERKSMPDQIKINVEINGQPGSLADVSLETLTGMRDKATPTVKPKPKPKPIEHGEYGYIGRNYPPNHRLFLTIDGKIKAFAPNGDRIDRDDINAPCWRKDYTIIGSIFKDMQEKSK